MLCYVDLITKKRDDSHNWEWIFKLGTRNPFQGWCGEAGEVIVREQEGDIGLVYLEETGICT